MRRERGSDKERIRRGEGEVDEARRKRNERRESQNEVERESGKDWKRNRGRRRAGYSERESDFWREIPEGRGEMRERNTDRRQAASLNNFSWEYYRSVKANVLHPVD